MLTSRGPNERTPRMASLSNSAIVGNERPRTATRVVGVEVSLDPQHLHALEVAAMGEWRAPGQPACLCARRSDKGDSVCISYANGHASGSRCVFVEHDSMVLGHGPSSAVGVHADRTVACVRYSQEI